MEMPLLRTLKLISIGLLPLVVALLIVSCQPTSEDKPDLQVAEERAAEEPATEVIVETAIAQTVEAQTALDRIVQQTVEAELAATKTAAEAAQEPTETPDSDPEPNQEQVQQEDDPGGLDVADPESGIEPMELAADPDVTGGTPHLRVIYSSINVRNGPGEFCRPIGALLDDSVVPVKSVKRDGKWFEVTLPNGQDGWVAASVTEPVEDADMASVPINDTPYCVPTPTATATSTPTATNTSTPTSTSTVPANTPKPTKAPTTQANTPEPTNTAPAPVSTSTSTVTAPASTSTPMELVIPTATATDP